MASTIQPANAKSCLGTAHNHTAKLINKRCDRLQCDRLLLSLMRHSTNRVLDRLLLRSILMWKEFVRTVAICILSQFLGTKYDSLNYYFYLL